MSTWYNHFPALSDGTMRAIRQTVDEAFLGFARDYGMTLETLFEPLRQFLIATEKLLLEMPWLLVLVILMGYNIDMK